MHISIALTLSARVPSTGQWHFRSKINEQEIRGYKKEWRRTVVKSCCIQTWVPCGITANSLRRYGTAALARHPEGQLCQSSAASHRVAAVISDQSCSQQGAARHREGLASCMAASAASLLLPVAPALAAEGAGGTVEALGVLGIVVGGVAGALYTLEKQSKAKAEADVASLQVRAT